MKLWRVIAMGLGLLWPGMAAQALEAGDLQQAGLSEQMAQWAAKAVRGEWGSVGAYGQLGAFGVALAGLGEYRIEPERFLEDPNAQARFWLGRERRIWEVVVRNGLDEAIGRDLCHEDMCAAITASSLLAVCREGCAAPESPMRRWLQSIGCDGPESGRICRTMIENAGHAVGEITGRSER